MPELQIASGPKFINGYQHRIRPRIITRHVINGRPQLADGLSKAGSLPIGRSLQIRFYGYTESPGAVKLF